MCGLVGAFGPSAGELATRLSSALTAMRHRGPDAGGEYRAPDGLCILGHRRLAIVDLSDQAAQPMRCDSQWLVYNGEIYNHSALRATMPETTWVSHSDTETLSRLLAQGEAGAVLASLNGMFAGARYDETTQTLTLFRDGLGIKPLYLAQLPDTTLIFASEIRTLLALAPQWQRRVNGAVLAQYLMFENWPQGESLFENIRLLPPGACMMARMAGSQVQTGEHRFVRETANPVIQTDVGWEDRVAFARHQLESSVTSHLMSDVPLGAYLSGGIDSGLVSTLAARHQADILGFTGYFEGDDHWYDERPFTRQVASRAGIPLVEVPVRASDWRNSFDDVIHTLEEPRMGMGTFSQFVVAREAARQRKVILAGHGGDELFGGYPLFKAFWWLQQFPAARSWRVLTRFSVREFPWLVDMVMQVMRTGELRFAPNLFGKLAATLPTAMQKIPEAFVQARQRSPLAQLNRYYVDTYLPGLLMVEDKISMRHSLETRVPLWSQELVRQIAPLPVEDKLRGGELKAMLKAVARNILPAPVLSAPKRGFPTPLRHWFRGDLRDAVRERLLSHGSAIHSLMPQAAIEKLLKHHDGQPLPFALDERRAHRIWMLLCLESWSRQYRVPLEVA
ncbi:MAG: asparagine synthase (glutamine-hydrolyzing) [Candidatus Melainabacteria bacterium]